MTLLCVVLFWQPRLLSGDYSGCNIVLSSGVSAVVGVVAGMLAEYAIKDDCSEHSSSPEASTGGESEEVFSPITLDIEMMTISGVSFSMGDSEEGAGNGESDELPVHTVAVSDLLVGRYEVKCDEWTKAREWGRKNGYTMGHGKIDSGNDYPVASVSWYDAVKWCNALSEMKGLDPVYTVDGNVFKAGFGLVVMNINNDGYRLLTEGEWEFAARGGLSGKIYPLGDVLNENQAVYGNNEGGILPVGSKPAGENGYGLCDMAGSLSEWVGDWYSDSYYDSSPTSNPEGIAGGRVYRGGCYVNPASECRVAARAGADPFTRSHYLGFRVCRRQKTSPDEL